MENERACARTLNRAAIFAAVCFVVQFLGVMGVLASGLGQVVPVKSIYWITFLYEPKDYMEIGRLEFILMALAFNTAVCTLLFGAGCWLKDKVTQSKAD